MNFFKKIAVVAVIGPVIALGQSETDKAGSVAFKFLNLQYSARGGALGGLAAQSSGAEALFANPAGIAHATGIGISAGMTQWIVETNYLNAGVVVPMAGGVLGLSALSVSYGDMMKSGWSTASDGSFVFGANQGKFSASDAAFQVSYATNLSGKFSIGGTAKFLTEEIDTESFTGFGFDLGTQFSTGYRGIKLGAVISNFGPDVQPVKRPAGSSYVEFSNMSLPMTFSFGVVGEAIPGLTAGVNVTKYADVAQRFAFNAEYSLLGLIALRGSYTLGDDQAPLSVGAGARMMGCSVDMGLTNTADFGAVMRFGVGYAL